MNLTTQHSNNAYYKDSTEVYVMFVFFKKIKVSSQWKH